MTRLPAWCNTPVARALLNEIIAEGATLGSDHTRLPATFGGHREPCKPRYTGQLAGRLRQIHRDWIEREYARLDRLHPDDMDAWKAAAVSLNNAPDAEDVIAQALAEAGRKVAA